MGKKRNTQRELERQARRPTAKTFKVWEWKKERGD